MTTYKTSVLFSLIISFAMVFPMKASDEALESLVYYGFFLVPGLVAYVAVQNDSQESSDVQQNGKPGWGITSYIQQANESLQTTADHTSEKFTSDAGHEAKNFVRYFLGEPKVEKNEDASIGDKNVQIEDKEVLVVNDDKQKPPIEKISQELKRTSEELTSDAKHKAENFVRYFLGEPEVEKKDALIGDKNVQIEDKEVLVVKDDKKAPIKIISQELKRTSEELTSDAKHKAENFVKYLLGEPEVEKKEGASIGDKGVPIIVEDKQKSPIEKASDKFKTTIEETGHELTVDLAQNLGRMMLSYTLGLFGAFFTYKQVVDYFAFQEKVDQLDISAQEQKMHFLPCGNLSQFLQKREAALIAAKRQHFERQQNRKLYLAGCGTLTFATACGLCSYWIQ